MHQSPKAFTLPSQRLRDPFERISGRDPALLDQCTRDERVVAGALGAAAFCGSAVHGLGMGGALHVLNLPTAGAVIIASITALGVLAMDRVILQAADLSAGESALRRIGGSDIPRLSGRFGGLATRGMRVLFAGTTALSLSGFLGLHFLDADLRDQISADQAALDAPLIAADEARETEARNALVSVVGGTNAALAQQAERRRKAGQAEEIRVAAETAKIKTLETREAEAAGAAKAARDEARAQRELATCELLGTAPDRLCPSASGRPGEGPRHKLAVARAIEADALAEEKAVLRAEAKRDLTGARATFRPAAVAPHDDSSLKIAARTAREDLAAHDAGRANRVATMLETDPGRRVLDPDSLSLRLEALWALVRENPALLGAYLAIALTALALELLPQITSIATARGEYVQLRARRLHEISLALTRLNRAELTADVPSIIKAEDARRRIRAEESGGNATERREYAGIRAEELRSERLRKSRANDMFERVYRGA